jgi:hypothetical protein
MEYRMLEELCRAAVRTGSGFRRKVGRQMVSPGGLSVWTAAAAVSTKTTPTKGAPLKQGVSTRYIVGKACRQASIN